jgi:hypothetical protein
VVTQKASAILKTIVNSYSSKSSLSENEWVSNAGGLTPTEMVCQVIRACRQMKKRHEEKTALLEVDTMIRGTVT